MPIAVYGTQFWKAWNFAPCSIALGEPFLLEGFPKGGKGYKEASVEIERRINVLFDWLADVHARGPPAQPGAAAVNDDARPRTATGDATTCSARSRSSATRTSASRR